MANVWRYGVRGSLREEREVLVTVDSLRVDVVCGELLAQELVIPTDQLVLDREEGWAPIPARDLGGLDQAGVGEQAPHRVMSRTALKSLVGS